MGRPTQPLPENIRKLWHPTKNGILTPDDVHRSTKTKAWFKCTVSNSDDHEWESAVFSQVKYPGCPCCSGQKVVPSTCLAMIRPDIAEQWDQELNGDLRPEDVTPASAKKVWWRCSADSSHTWCTQVFARTKNGNGCPVCSNRKVTHSTSLAVLRPDLAAEWDLERNFPLTPHDVVPGSGKKVWWMCTSGHDDHRWEAYLHHRTVGGRKSQGTGCPFCSNQKLSKSNTLAAVRPDLAAEWHPTKNGSATPYNVIAGSTELYFWLCPRGSDHEWRASLAQRINAGSGCPCCCGRKVVKSNNLYTTHPKIAAEWDYAKNDSSMTPETVTYATNKYAWWNCENNHSWRTMICTRVGCGCPKCASSKGEKAIREYFQSESIDFTEQYRFMDCCHKRPLPFDFAVLGESGVPVGLIEFQGRHHFDEIFYFRIRNAALGVSALADRKIKDGIKRKYCETRKIPFLEIPYWDLEKIPDTLGEFLKTVRSK